MTFSYSTGNPYRIGVTSAQSKTLLFQVNGDLNTALTQVYAYSTSYISSVTKEGGEQGKYVLIKAVLRPYSQTSAATADIGFDLMFTDGTSHRTTSGDSLQIVITQSNGEVYANVPSLIFSSQVYECGKDADTYQNRFTLSNVRDFSIVYPREDWIVVEEAERTSDNGGYVEFSVTNNYQAGYRRCNVGLTYTGTNGERYNASFVVSQQGTDSSLPDGEITLGEEETTIGYEGGQIGILYTSENVDSIGVVPEVSWIGHMYHTEDTIYLAVSRNDTNTARNGRVTVSGRTSNGNIVDAYITVYQIAEGDMPELNLSSSSVTVTYSAGTNGDISYTTTDCDHMVVKTSADWITIDPRSEIAAFGHIQFEVTENPLSQRSATITVRNYGDNEIYTEKTITVTQEEYPNWQSKPRVELPSAIALSTWAETSGQTVYTLYNVQNGREIAYIEDPTISYAVTSNSGSSGVLTYYVRANDTDSEREITVGVEAYDLSGNTVYGYLTLIQPAAPSSTEFPIWKNTPYSITSNTSTITDYRIGNIYAGRVIGNPATIQLDRILRQHISESLDMTRLGLQDNGGFISETLYINEVPKEIIRTYNDWSYEETDRKLLSEPIRHTLAEGQYIPCSFRGVDNSSTITVEKDGIPTQFTLGMGLFTHLSIADSDVTYIYGDEILELTLGDICPRYILYYRNLYGGYDFFIFHKGVMTDSYTRDKYETRALNTTPRHFWKNFSNSLKRSIELSTDYLKDDEMEMFARHLASSTECYLQDLVDGSIKPVNITTNSMKYNTFKSNGRRFFTASITVEQSQELLIKG